MAACGGAGHEPTRLGVKHQAISESIYSCMDFSRNFTECMSCGIGCFPESPTPTELELCVNEVERYCTDLYPEPDPVDVRIPVPTFCPERIPSVEISPAVGTIAVCAVGVCVIGALLYACPPVGIAATVIAVGLVWDASANTAYASTSCASSYPRCDEAELVCSSLGGPCCGGPGDPDPVRCPVPPGQPELHCDSATETCVE
jgi:hypothetical protein